MASLTKVLFQRKTRIICKKINRQKQLKTLWNKYGEVINTLLPQTSVEYLAIYINAFYRCIGLEFVAIICHILNNIGRMCSIRVGDV